jgi:hypothetical protein
MEEQERWLYWEMGVMVNIQRAGPWMEHACRTDEK